MREKITFLLLLSALAVPVWAVEFVGPIEPNNAKAFVITCTGLIDDGLYQSIKRRANVAIESGADYIFLEIGTYGGLVKSADDISKFLILELSKKAHTVAYITTEAISAGAMISVSCQDIIMKANTTIGDCAPITMGDKLEGVEREKAESFIRAAFNRAAEANKYPPALLEAMVSRHKKVWQIKNPQTGLYEYYEDEKLPKDANAYDIAEKNLIDNENEILTLTANKAKEYGVAREVVGGIDEAVDFLAKRDNVKFTHKIVRLEPNWSEQLVRMLNHPTLTGILFMVGMLGVYIELKTPGLLLPAAIAVICFAVLFGSKYLVGMATWWEAAIFAVGIALLFLEVFVIPGFGVAGVSGIICILVGLFGILVPNRPDELPWPRYDLGDMQWKMFNDSVLAMGIGFVGFAVLAYFLAKFLPKTSAFAGLVLSPAMAGEKLQIDSTAPPEETEELKVGDDGIAMTKLRPAGRAKFRQTVVDVVTEGDLIEKDEKVKIVRIEGNKVVVKKI